MNFFSIGDIFRYFFFAFLLVLILLPSFSFPFVIESDHRLETLLAEVSLKQEERRLRENHFGEEWAEGINFQTALWSRLSLGERLTLEIEPVFITPRDGRDVYFRKGSLRLVLWNIEFKVGRDSLWWGPGRHGALLLSNNTFPFDMIHVGTASPFRLPGILEPLGRFEAEGFLTRLERNRDFPHARLFGLRLVYRPLEEITIGLSRITMFGGEGRPGFTPIDFGKLYFSNPNKSGKFEVNELAGVDLRLRPAIDRILPGHAVELYGEYGGEDEAGFRPSKPALLVGLEWMYADLKLIIEHANNHLRNFPDTWYHHSLYFSGYTYRGNIIGHHMGSDAKDLYLRLKSPFLRQWTVGLDFEQENRHLSSPVQEEERRWGGDVTVSDRAGRSYSARLAYQRIKNLNLLPENERNVYGTVTVIWQF